MHHHWQGRQERDGAILRRYGTPGCRHGYLMSKAKFSTIGELRSSLEELLSLPDDAEVVFGCGDLSFKRVKNRSPLDPKLTRYYEVEFNELYRVTLDPADSE